MSKTRHPPFLRTFNAIVNLTAVVLYYTVWMVSEAVLFLAAAFVQAWHDMTRDDDPSSRDPNR